MKAHGKIFLPNFSDKYRGDHELRFGMSTLAVDVIVVTFAFNVQLKFEPVYFRRRGKRRH